MDEVFLRKEIRKAYHQKRNHSEDGKREWRIWLCVLSQERRYRTCCRCISCLERCLKCFQSKIMKVIFYVLNREKDLILSFLTSKPESHQLMKLVTSMRKVWIWVVIKVSELMSDTMWGGWTFLQRLLIHQYVESLKKWLNCRLGKVQGLTTFDVLMVLISELQI